MKLPSQRSKRERALKILERLKKDYPQFNITKTRGSDAIYITLPREKVRTPVAPRYAKDYAQLEVVINLAQRLASSMVRETMDGLLDKLVSRLSDGLVNELIEKMPTQQTVIREVASEASQRLRESFTADNPDLYAPASFDSGLELVGEAGTSETKSDASDLDAILAALEGKGGS